ncbi:hypothetical protein [Pantoea sp. CCBC3-3-1]|uniref:phage tail fiber protein n=1 Tax=Pantoea sp. CCBC3-3-1 TaxID=2490851 RepID=UPI0011BF242E|nr:hypothetical protein [Pantoea sp. CCBC3-3-1]
MPVNDFKAFATGENANVLSQAEYEELDAVDAGFQSGIARSEQLNKVWRQASTIAAVVAGFIADKSGNDVVDNGDTESLEASLLKALLNNSTSQLDGRYLKSASNLADVGNIAAARGNLGLGNLALKNSLTAADVGAYPISAGELKGEAWSTFVNNYRIIANNKGVFWRFDGSNYYLMLTNDGDPKGGWNSLRPLAIDYASGDMRTDHNFLANGRISGGKDIVAANSVYSGNGSAQIAPDGNINGGLWGGWLNNYLASNWNGAVFSSRRGGQQLYNPGFTWMGDWEAPEGCFLTGVRSASAPDGRKMGLFYRRVQLMNKLGAWWEIGD